MQVWGSSSKSDKESRTVMAPVWALLCAKSLCGSVIAEDKVRGAETSGSGEGKRGAVPGGFLQGS